jgi:multiple sugar transport system permease protein
MITDMKKFFYKRAGYLLLIPGIVVLLFLVIYPMVQSLWVSLHTWYIAKPQQFPFIGLRNYYMLIFEDNVFKIALRNTLVIVIVAVPIEFLLGLLLASLLNRDDIKGRKIFRAILVLPLAVMPIVVGVLWKFMLHPRYGIVNYFLGLLGVLQIQWIADPRFALLSVMMVDIWEWTPFMVLVLYAGLISVPREPLEAARIDGASDLQLFIRISFPLILPIIVVAILIRVMDIVKMFDIVYVLTRGGPGDSTELLSLYNFRVGLNYFYMGKAAALSWIIVVIVVIFSQIFLRVVKMERR